MFIDETLTTARVIPSGTNNTPSLFFTIYIARIFHLYISWVDECYLLSYYSKENTFA